MNQILTLGSIITCITSVIKLITIINKAIIKTSAPTTGKSLVEIELISICPSPGTENTCSITIPEQVTTIGTSAFYACDELTSITIPKSVSKIETWAFDECDKLTEINVDSSNIYYSSI